MLVALYCIAFVFIDFVHFPGSAVLTMLATNKCGMSLSKAIQNSFVSGKSAIRLTHPINCLCFLHVPSYNFGRLGIRTVCLLT